MSSEGGSKALGPGEGRTVAVLGLPCAFKVTGEDTAGAFCLVEFTLPGGTTLPPHTHKTEAEVAYVLEGQVDFQIEERTVKATSGSFVFVPKGMVHALSIPEQRSAKVLHLWSPAGFEKLLAELDGETDMEKVGALMAKYGMEFVAMPQNSDKEA